MACSTGCPTKDCPSFAACLRGKGTKVAYANSATGLDYSRQKKWDRELDNYRAARAEGMQPEGTAAKDVEHARRVSDQIGAPFRADV